MKEAKRAIGLGIVSVLLLVLSSQYAITFNESRLVAPDGLFCLHLSP